MTDIKPVIFTRGRLNNQVTLSQMPDYMKAQTTMVVYPSEYQAHRELYGTICQVVSAPEHVQGIAKRRRWAALRSTKRIQWQLDDDLTFCKAKEEGRDGSWPFLKFEPMQEEDWYRLEEDIVEACDIGFKCGGLGQRISPSGISDFPGSVNSRVYTNTWFDFRTIEPRDFDWIGTEWEKDEFLPEDFHIQCQMVKKGIPILNLNKYATGGNKTQAAGGCATTRTLTNHNNGMKRFAEVWSDCATLRWKDGWEKGSKKAALTLRLSKLYPHSKTKLDKMEDKMRLALGGMIKSDAKILQKKANELRKELQINAV